jgi:hypothetical protein
MSADELTSAKLNAVKIANSASSAPRALTRRD